MLYLLLAIACTSTISIVMRFSKEKVTNKMMMFLTNYVVCIICSLFFIGDLSAVSLKEASFTIWFGVLTGVGYLSCFLLTELNIRKNGVVLSSAFSKLGLLVPIFISIVFYKEMPGPLKIIGIVMAILAIILMNVRFEKKVEGVSKISIASLLLIVLMLLGGITDASSTIFEHNEDFKFKGLFLTIIFGSALICSLVILLSKHEKISYKDCLFGIMIGIPNYFSTFFLLNSLRTLDATVVYPTYSVASIAIISLFGLVVFKEKLKLNEIIALVIIVSSLVLLNI